METALKVEVPAQVEVKVKVVKVKVGKVKVVKVKVEKARVVSLRFGKMTKTNRVDLRYNYRYLFQF